MDLFCVFCVFCVRFNSIHVIVERDKFFNFLILYNPLTTIMTDSSKRTIKRVIDIIITILTAIITSLTTTSCVG